MGGKRGATVKASPSGTEAASSADKHPRACLHRQLQKTRLCVYHMRGTCQYGTSCSFAHTQSELSSTPDLQRTRLCTSFAKGQCDNPNCSFAHGEAELRSTDMFYKKQMCIWHERGRCRNGESCRFAHGPSELREKSGRSQVAAPQGVSAQSSRPCDDPAMQAVVAQAQVLAAAFVAGQVSAQKGAVESAVPTQHRPVQQPRPLQHQNIPSLEQQHMIHQQMMRARETLAQSQARTLPSTLGEPMKVTSGNLHVPQPRRNEPPASAMQFGNNVPKELAALGQLAIQLHQAGISPPPASFSSPTPLASNSASSPAVSGALAALAALQDANLVCQMAGVQQHADSKLQAELAKLCEGISTLSVQCNRLQQQVQSQLSVNPGSTGSVSTTAESLPGWGSHSEMDESFSQQVSPELNPALLSGNRDIGSLAAQDSGQGTAQWAAALRLVAGLQHL